MLAYLVFGGGYKTKAELVAELLDRGLLKKTGHEQQSGFCSIPLMEVLFVRNPLTDSPFI